MSNVGLSNLERDAVGGRLEIHVVLTTATPGSPH
jgi:hypothetical protein